MADEVVKVKRKRDVRPLVAMAQAETGEMVLIPGFPNITRREKAIAWAQKQAETGHRSIQFYRKVATFAATAQTVMKFEVE